MVQCTLDIVDGRIWHTAAFKGVQPFFCGFRPGFGFYETVYLFAMLHSLTVDREPRVFLPLREA